MSENENLQNANENENANGNKYAGRVLLYDPMFDPKMKEAARKRGRNTFLKIVFTVMIVSFIAVSLYFSFRSISKDKFDFRTTEDGAVQLYLFSGKEEDAVLFVDYQRDKNGGNPDETKPVEVVREYAVSTNEYLHFIVLGKGVRQFDARSFYSCKNLYGVIVDEANEHYKVIDGVVYELQNGVPVTAVFFPAKRAYALCAEKLGAVVPTKSDEIDAFLGFLETHKDEIDRLYDDKTEDGEEKSEDELIRLRITMPETVTAVGQIAFTYAEKLAGVTLHEGLTDIGPMAFMRCGCFENLSLPSTLKTIGSDAFSYDGKIDTIFIPASVEKIGHHAFFETGAAEVKMELSEADVQAKVDLGDSWAPKVRKGFMVSVPILYSQGKEAE